MSPEVIMKELVTSALFLVPIVFGLVEFLKAAFELEGKSVTWCSFGVGIVFGALTFAAYLLPDWGQYVAGGVFVVSLGLVASGFYKFVDARIPNGK